MYLHLREFPRGLVILHILNLYVLAQYLVICSQLIGKLSNPRHFETNRVMRNKQESQSEKQLGCSSAFPLHGWAGSAGQPHPFVSSARQELFTLYLPNRHCTQNHYFDFHSFHCHNTCSKLLQHLQCTSGQQTNKQCNKMKLYIVYLFPKYFLRLIMRSSYICMKVMAYDGIQSDFSTLISQYATRHISLILISKSAMHYLILEV